ncbi:MAG: helix-turn-helix domain-containing protein [Candidatus Parvarchaeota archaeon]|nr:helix-turn-helix domain-containing protein [Candidatus Jingweiarchaeum tengchongense]
MHNERLTKFRKQRKMSMRALAKAAGVDPSTISRYERGLLNISYKRMDQIAACLDVPPEELFTEFKRFSPYPKTEGSK